MFECIFTIWRIHRNFLYTNSNGIKTMSQTNIILTATFQGNRSFLFAADPTHLHQLLLLLGERPRILCHCLQVPFGASSFEGPQRQMLAVSFQQVGGAAHRDLMELGGGESRGQTVV